MLCDTQNPLLHGCALASWYRGGGVCSRKDGGYGKLGTLAAEADCVPALSVGAEGLDLCHWQRLLLGS